MPAAGSETAPRPPLVRGRYVRNLIARIRDTLGLFTGLHRDHGDIVRYRILFLEFCILFDPELIREVIDEQRASFEKGFIYKRNTVLHGPTLVTGDGDDHRRRRRIIQPFFHREALAGYAGTMAERAIAKREAWRPGRIIDADREMRNLTLSITLAVFFEDRTRVDIKMARDLIALLVLDFQLALLPGRALIKRALPRYRRLQRLKEPLDEIILASIRTARADPGSRTDLVAFLVHAAGEQGKPAFSETEVLDEVIEMLMASHETTGATLAWAFYFLSRNPALRERLEQEVDAVLGERPAALADYDRLAFTRAVLDETLRLATPSYYIGRRAIARLRHRRLRRSRRLQRAALLLRRPPRSALLPGSRALPAGALAGAAARASEVHPDVFRRRLARLRRRGVRPHERGLRPGGGDATVAAGCGLGAAAGAEHDGGLLLPRRPAGAGGRTPARNAGRSVEPRHVDVVGALLEPERHALVVPHRAREQPGRPFRKLHEGDEAAAQHPPLLGGDSPADPPAGRRAGSATWGRPCR